MGDRRRLVSLTMDVYPGVLFFFGELGKAQPHCLGAALVSVTPLAARGSLGDRLEG